MGWKCLISKEKLVWIYFRMNQGEKKKEKKTKRERAGERGTKEREKKS